MDSRQWDNCDDPRVMLDFLSDRVADRKLRLFACACCREVWHLLDAESRRGGFSLATL